MTEITVSKSSHIKLHWKTKSHTDIEEEESTKCVPVLAGIQFIFSTVPGMGLYFGFVLKTELLTPGYFNYCWAVLTQSRPFLFVIPPHQRVGWGCMRSWEGTHPGQLTPKGGQKGQRPDKRDAPYFIASCSAYKPGQSWLETTAQGLTGHQWVGGEQNLSLLGFIYFGWFVV